MASCTICYRFCCCCCCLHVIRFHFGQSSSTLFTFFTIAKQASLVCSLVCVIGIDCWAVPLPTMYESENDNVRLVTLCVRCSQLIFHVKSHRWNLPHKYVYFTRFFVVVVVVVCRSLDGCRYTCAYAAYATFL